MVSANVNFPDLFGLTALVAYIYVKRNDSSQRKLRVLNESVSRTIGARSLVFVRKSVDGE